MVRTMHVHIYLNNHPPSVYTLPYSQKDSGHGEESMTAQEGPGTRSMLKASRCVLCLSHRAVGKLRWDNLF